MRLPCLLWVALVLGGCRPDPEPFHVSTIRGVPPHFPEWVEAPDNALNEAKWELGRHLFFDTRLSEDGAVSCASCHNPSFAFGDTVTISTGTNGNLGSRNAPALVNMAWQPRFHREGGVPSLEAQVLAPLQEPTELHRDLAQLVDELALDPLYQSWASQGFGRPFDAFVLTRSLAAFQRTLISGDSPYDRWLLGDEEALSELELEGLALFEANECSSCHQGVLLSDFETHNVGLYAFYEDPGAYRLTFDSIDLGAFKTPSLRNVGLTAPYMFDGSLATLEDVVDHYDAGGMLHPNQDPRVRPRNLSAPEKAALVAFLRALTDDNYVRWAQGLQP